ncbi:MAG TPA: hypothetical protein DEQ34_05940 [Balneolaceae bacterium]|nr:hypothetical protein [Balneolaceae bacterium]|tara:strand:+ start:151587 stop:152339 length:753 start_codon:yes stop_codon:yes gene_type:complete
MEEQTNTCLNCGSAEVQNYCPVCGQKAQPTRLPLKLFFHDAIESLFNIDNRWLKTLRDLFIKPGKVTREYIEGKRARYLPPLRIYISISIIYFLAVQFYDSSQVFFISFNAADQKIEGVGTVVQYSLFFLVPLFGLILKLFYLKRKAYYVEYLIMALHIHTIWFVLLLFDIFAEWMGGLSDHLVIKIIATIITIPTTLGVFVYPAIYQKRTFNDSWLKVIFKSFGQILLYVTALISIVGLYYYVIFDLIK